MRAFDLLLGSERVMWRLRHRGLDLALLIGVVLGAFVLVAILFRSNQPVVTLVNLDRGPIGQQLARALLSSSSLRVHEQDGSAATNELRSGNADAYIFFRPDFSARALANHVLTPEIHLAAGSSIRADTVLQVFSQSLLSSAGAGGLQLQPRLNYGVAGALIDPIDYSMVGALAVALYLFALFLPLLAVEETRGKPLGMVLGSALGCAVIALIVGLVLLMLYLGPLHLHNAGSIGLVVLVEVLAAASAVLIGVALGAGHIEAARAAWVYALLTVAQVLLCGAMFAVNAEPAVVRTASGLLPLTNVVDALRNVMLRRAGIDWPAMQRDLASLLGFTLLLCGAISFLLRPRGGSAKAQFDPKGASDFRP